MLQCRQQSVVWEPGGDLVRPPKTPTGHGASSSSSPQHTRGRGRCSAEKHRSKIICGKNSDHHINCPAEFVSHPTASPAVLADAAQGRHRIPTAGVQF